MVVCSTKLSFFLAVVFPLVLLTVLCNFLSRLPMTEQVVAVMAAAAHMVGVVGPMEEAGEDMVVVVVVPMVEVSQEEFFSCALAFSVLLLLLLLFLALILTSPVVRQHLNQSPYLLEEILWPQHFCRTLDRSGSPPMVPMKYI